MTSRTWKARVFAATSLDGSIARQNHDIRWLTQPAPNPSHVAPSDAKSTPSFEKHSSEVDFIVLGRETFEVCLTFPQWPYPLRRLLVLSTTLKELPGNAPPSSRVAGSVEEAARVLSEERATMVYVDGGKTVQEFLRRGWVDEMVLTLAPVLLGGERGRPLFTDLNSPGDVRFTLCGVDVIADGMVSCYYRVSR